MARSDNPKNRRSYRAVPTPIGACPNWAPAGVGHVHYYNTETGAFAACNIKWRSGWEVHWEGNRLKVVAADESTTPQAQGESRHKSTPMRES